MATLEDQIAAISAALNRTRFLPVADAKNLEAARETLLGLKQIRDGFEAQEVYDEGKAEVVTDLLLKLLQVRHE